MNDLLLNNVPKYNNVRYCLYIRMIAALYYIYITRQLSHSFENKSWIISKFSMHNKDMKNKAYKW